MSLNESIIEDAALEQFGDVLGTQPYHAHPQPA